MSARHPKGLDVTQIFAKAYKKSKKDDDERGKLYLGRLISYFPPNLKARFPYYLSVLHKIRPNIIQDNLHGGAGVVDGHYYHEQAEKGACMCRRARLFLENTDFAMVLSLSLSLSRLLSFTLCMSDVASFGNRDLLLGSKYPVACERSFLFWSKPGSEKPLSRASVNFFGSRGKQ
jgi:hypothetical protein